MSEQVENTWGDLGTHFESEIEAANLVEKEVVRTRSWIEKRYPHWFMWPGEVISFLEEVRWDVANDLETKKAA